MKELTKKWLSENSLKLHELLSIAFIDNRAYEDFVDHGKGFTTKYRLFLATNLPEFELTDDERMRYNNFCLQNTNTVIDEKICKYFSEKFRLHGSIPEQEHLLMLSIGNKRSKTLMRSIIYDFITGNSSKTYLVEQQNKDEKAHTVDAEVQSLVEQLQEVLLKTLHRQYGDNERKNFIIKNKETLRNLQRVITLALQDNPEEALKQISQFKQTVLNPGK